MRNNRRNNGSFWLISTILCLMALLISVGCDSDNPEEAAPPGGECSEEGALRCTGMMLQRCVYGYWVSWAACDRGGETCQAVGGVPQCVCIEDQTKCVGNVLKKCVGTVWTVAEDCVASGVSCLDVQGEPMCCSAITDAGTCADDEGGDTDTDTE